MNIFLSASLFACAACGGDPASPLTKGVLAGVLFLLGVIVFVLLGIATTVWSWSRRAKKISAAGG